MNHPFRVNGSIDSGGVNVTIDMGFVNWREPKIGGQKIGGWGTDGKRFPQPILSDSLKYDEYHRCYISLKVKVDDDGTMPADPPEDYLTIVVTNKRTCNHDYGPGYWLHPIAVINKSDRPKIVQCVHYNLLHYVGITAGITGIFAAFNRVTGNAVKFSHFFTAI